MGDYHLDILDRIIMELLAVFLQKPLGSSKQSMLEILPDCVANGTLSTPQIPSFSANIPSPAAAVQLEHMPGLQH